MCRHFLVGLLGVLIFSAQVGPARASVYGDPTQAYACTSDADCQYEGCHDVSCACAQPNDQLCVDYSAAAMRINPGFPSGIGDKASTQIPYTRFLFDFW